MIQLAKLYFLMTLCLLVFGGIVMPHLRIEKIKEVIENFIVADFLIGIFGFIAMLVWGVWRLI